GILGEVSAEVDTGQLKVVAFLPEALDSNVTTVTAFTTSQEEVSRVEVPREVGWLVGSKTQVCHPWAGREGTRVRALSACTDRMPMLAPELARTFAYGPCESHYVRETRVTGQHSKILKVVARPSTRNLLTSANYM
ncbi:unnamed protein product, partial [Symbiodinium sp. KB8]